MKNKVLIITIILFSFSILTANESEIRYDIINNYILSQYNRPVTTLELSPKGDFISLEVAKNFNAVCVVIEDIFHYPQAYNLSRSNDLENIIILDKKINTEDLKILSKCEHFDIIWGFDIFDCIDNDRELLTDIILNMGDFAVVGVPRVPQLCSIFKNSVIMNNKKIIQKIPFSDKDIFIVECNKDNLEYNCWIRKNRAYNRQYIIESNFYDKKFIKKTKDNIILSTSEWKPGINLVTYKMCNGIYPSLEDVEEMVIQSRNSLYTADWLPHNLVIQGKRIELIDTNDSNVKFHNNRTSETVLRNVLIWLKELPSTPEKAGQFYQKVIMNNVERFKDQDISVYLSS